MRACVRACLRACVRACVCVCACTRVWDDFFVSPCQCLCLCLLSVRPSVCISVFLFVCPSVCVSVCNPAKRGTNLTLPLPCPAELAPKSQPPLEHPVWPRTWAELSTDPPKQVKSSSLLQKPQNINERTSGKTRQ